MSATFEEFQEKFKVEKLKIVSSDHWTWSVRPTHSTIGSGVLSLNRFCTSFASMTRDEAEDLSIITKEIEGRLKRCFAPDKFNYLMLMMVDDHLHFHVIPRYGKNIEFEGYDWKDTGWPALPNLGEGSDLSEDEVLVKVANRLKSA